MANNGRWFFSAASPNLLQVNGLIGHLQLKVNGDVKRQKQDSISGSSSCPNLSNMDAMSVQPRPSSAALPGSAAWSILVCVNSPMEHKLLQAKINAAATLFDLGHAISVIPTSTAADDILRGLQLAQRPGSTDGSGARQGGLLCAILETDGCIRSTMSTIEVLRSNGLGPQVPLVLLTTMSDRMLLTGSDSHDEDPSVPPPPCPALSLACLDCPWPAGTPPSPSPSLESAHALTVTFLLLGGGCRGQRLLGGADQAGAGGTHPWAHGPVGRSAIHVQRQVRV